MRNIRIRPVEPKDREQLIAVEAKSTPNLRYIPHVFNQFVADQHGEFSLAEVDGEVVACGKFTVVPDGSAWLETLRVIPEWQRMGVGKRLYERFFEIAQREGVTTMRMYTGVKNAVSKGLAEHFGFQLAATFAGAWRPCAPADSTDLPSHPSPPFERITDSAKAIPLLMPHSDLWNGFLVMNRTFYTLTPALCTYLAQAGQVYADPMSDSVAVLGARFMPEEALHIGLFVGDVDACLRFAKLKGIEANAQRLSCLCPAVASATQRALTERGFQREPSNFIVMEKLISP